MLVVQMGGSRIYWVWVLGFETPKTNLGILSVMSNHGWGIGLKEIQCVIRELCMMMNRLNSHLKGVIGAMEQISHNTTHMDTRFDDL